MKDSPYKWLTIILISLITIISISVLSYKHFRNISAKPTCVDLIVYTFAEEQFERAPNELYNEKFATNGDVYNTYMYPPLTLYYFKLIKDLTNGY